MANRYISIHNPNPVHDMSKLVYADLAMQSVPSTIYLKQVYDNSQFSAKLSSDFTQNTREYGGEHGLSDDATDYINWQDIVNGGSSGNISLIADLIPNTDNIQYNTEARKKAHFKLQKNINVNAIRQALHNIFSWTPGERILNPEFGNKLRQYLYEGITSYNKEQIMAEIQHCITEWEPRVEILHVYDMSKVIDTENNTVKIEIVYTIPSLTTEQFSYVYESQLAE